MELALNGTYDILSGIIVPGLSDTLNCLAQNLQSGVKKYPTIFIAYPQNRFIPSGIEFLVNELTGIKKKLENIKGGEISEEDIQRSIKIYNEHKVAMREFSKLAASHPRSIKASDRCYVLKSGYFMLKEENNELLKEINAVLESMPNEDWDGVKVVTSGIITDNEGLLEVFDNYKVCIVADDVAHESRALKIDIDLSISDPMLALADQFARMDEDPILFDPDITKRPEYVLNLAKENKADGCLLFMMNFNDTEEMEYPSLKQAFDKARVPLIKMGYDQQMVDFGQVKTQLETFREIVELNRA